MTAPANLLVLLSDNHHRGFMGAYGHPQAVTPNLDRLAATGTRFTDAYAASPLCCPSRAAIATGRFPHRTGCWDNAIVYDGRVASWMHRLRAQGHAVVAIGKLHFRSTEDDNGFSAELLPMHILNGKGGVHMLSRGYGEEVPNKGQFELYMERSGIGEAPYQGYDRKIAEEAVRWLGEEAGRQAKPWVLFVSFPSTHPPFTVPERLWRLQDEASVPLPADWRPEDRPEHPAIVHLRKIMGTLPITDEAALRRVRCGYLGLVAHLDEQIGRVLAALDGAGLAASTRVLYTSDHGDLAGEHGLLGKCCLYEGSIGVPLLLSGPGIPAGRVVRAPVSHVDLFPTIVAAVGGSLAAEDSDLPGRSLLATIADPQPERPVLAEYHATGAKAGMFMLRRGRFKLVHHVGMPPQLFDLEADPDELDDLAPGGAHADVLADLERELRRRCDPEAIDAQAKADQRAKADYWGGRDAIVREGTLVYTPPPGAVAEIVR